MRTDARPLADAASVQDLEVDWRAICCPWVEVISIGCVGASVLKRMLAIGAALAAH